MIKHPVTIERTLLREQVRDAIAQQIIEGQLPAGARINESELALELGVSRTPLREALHHLEQERFVEAVPGRGFLVVPLSERDVKDIYPMVALVEGHALKTSEPSPDLAAINELNKQMFIHRDDPATCLALDAQLHQLLTANCDNARAQDILADLRRLMQRYEAAYMQDTVAHPDGKRTMESSVTEHEVILDCLGRGDRDGAAAALQVNWQNGMERLLEILESRTRAEAS